MSSDIDDAPPPGTTSGDDQIAIARGHLAAALARCDPAGPLAMEIALAWSGLDEPGRLPDILATREDPEASVLDCLELALESLRSAVRVIEPAARALTIAYALNEIKQLSDGLRGVPDGDAAH